MISAVFLESDHLQMISAVFLESDHFTNDQYVFLEIDHFTNDQCNGFRELRNLFCLVHVLLVW